MEYLDICMEQCNREMTIKDILNNKYCNFCDVPYIYLEQLPQINEKLEKENNILKDLLYDAMASIIYEYSTNITDDLEKLEQIFNLDDLEYIIKYCKGESIE